MTPRAWVSITGCSRVLAGATGANLVRACSVKGRTGTPPSSC
jgi:hypothetical protein